DHQAVLDVVEGLHPVGDRDGGRIAPGDRVILSANERGDAEAELGGDDLLISEVEHLELIEQLIDLADLVAARVAGTDLRAPVVLELLDTRARFLNHPVAPTVK